MIDNFSLGLTHGLMLLTVWLAIRRPDLDHEPPAVSAPDAGPNGGRRPRA